MDAVELAAGVQFTVDQQGRTTAVVVDPGLWQRIMEALEEAEDRALVEALRDRLVRGPTASGALRWQDARDEWL